MSLRCFRSTRQGLHCPHSSSKAERLQGLDSTCNASFYSVRRQQQGQKLYTAVSPLFLLLQKLSYPEGVTRRILLSVCKAETWQFVKIQNQNVKADCAFRKAQLSAQPQDSSFAGKKEPLQKYLPSDSGVWQGSLH